ncbi:MAG: lysylphosphatidylglycerol synthase transmembrane domain-containing protein [Ignavibacteriaceae bacterium]
MPEKLKKRILISIILAGIIYLAFTVYADIENLTKSLLLFSWVLIPVLLSLSLLNYITRFYKWNYYLKLLSIPLGLKDSFLIFMSGLIMSITPGKMGELLKSWLVKEAIGEPISKTAPIVFAERLTDFVSLLVITLIGAYTFNYGRQIIIIISLVFLFLIIILSSGKPALVLINQLEKIRFLRKYIKNIHSAYQSSYQMLRPAPLFRMTLLSLVSWGFECLGYYLILINFNAQISVFWASFSYAFATVVGAVSMLPGGLGVTEGSLTLTLIQFGLQKDMAVAATFIIRAVTLWFAVLVGIVNLMIYQKQIKKLNLNSF